MAKSDPAPYKESLLYEHLFKRANDAILLFDEHDNIIDVNEQACRLYGYSREEFLALTLADLKPKALKPPSSQHMKWELEKFGNKPFEVEDIKKDGTRFYVEVTNTAVHYEVSLFILTIVRDVSKRRRLETELRGTEALEKSIIESPKNVNIWAIDREYRYTFFNDAHREGMKRFWGADIELGVSVLDYLSDPKYREHVRNNYERLMAGESFSEIDEIEGSDGEAYYFQNVGNPTRDQNGNITGAVILTTDVTERYRLQIELRRFVALLESIMDSPQGILIHSIDRECRYRFFNNAHKQAMIDVWGNEPKIGDNVLDLLTDEAYREKVKFFVDRALQGENFCDIEDFIDTLGRRRFYECISAPIKDKEGSILGLTVFNIDITERVAAEEKLRENLKEKEVLLREIHHRVKNNLQIITSMLNLQIGGIHSNEVRSVLIDSQNRIASMAMIHEQLYQSENLARINMREYIRSLVLFIQDSFDVDKKHVHIEFSLDPIELVIDHAIPVGLIVNELVCNSFKYAFNRRDAGALSVSMKEKPAGGRRLVIEDNGNGLPQGFDKSSLDTLGLQIVESLSTQLGGSFSIENRAGERGVRAVVEL